MAQFLLLLMFLNAQPFSTHHKVRPSACFLVCYVICILLLSAHVINGWTVAQGYQKVTISVVIIKHFDAMENNKQIKMK